jgi:hypothetical protein
MKNIQNTMKTLVPSAHIIRIFVVLFAVLCLVYAGLFRENMLYQDDHGRYINGDTWHHDARPLQMVFYNLFSGNMFLTKTVNSSPLSLFITLAFLAIISMMLVRLFMPTLTWLASILALLVAVAPFISQNMLYQYDALGMVLALLFAILPFLHQRRLWPKEVFLLLFALITGLTIIAYFSMLWPLWLLMIGLWLSLFIIKNHRTQQIIIALFCLLVVSYTYQSALGVYLVLILVFAVDDLLQADKKVGTIFMGLLTQLGLILFLFMIIQVLQATGKPGLTINNYLNIKGANGTGLLPIHEMIPTVWGRLNSLVSIFKNDWFMPHNFLGYVIVALGTLWISVVTGALIKQENKDRWVKLGLLLLIFIAMLMSPFASTLFFQTFVTQYRTMYTVNVLLAVWVIHSIFLLKQYGIRHVVSILAGILLYMSLHYQATLHHMFGATSRYVESVFMITANDVAKEASQYPNATVVVQKVGGDPYPFLWLLLKSPSLPLYPAIRSHIDSMFHKSIVMLSYQHGYRANYVINKEEYQSTLLQTTAYAHIFLLTKPDEQLIYVEWRGKE